MSETMNLRPFANLPETDAIKEGDKVLVNQDGMAKQLDASKLGGGGGGTIYAEFIFPDQEGEIGVVRVYADEAHSVMLTYEQANEKFKSGAVLFGPAFDANVIITPLAVSYMDANKAFLMQVIFEGLIPFNVICADTIT